MIRELRESDRKGWQRLYEGYQAFYNFPDRPAEFYDKAFARLMSRNVRDLRGLIYEDGGRLLGLTHYVFHPNLWRDEGVCYLQDLFTSAEARGRGVAQALLAALIPRARACGKHVIVAAELREMNAPRLSAAARHRECRRARRG